MVKGITKSGGQKNHADKFYTKPEIAKECISLLVLDDYSRIIEPSAGNGSFSNQLKGCLAFDLFPEHSSITRQDFLQYSGKRLTDGKTLVIGNPPFGQQNSLAVKFINHAALFADDIAFILPISFKKSSIRNRLHPNLHLIHETILPINAFNLNGEDYKVLCVFQIWNYQPENIRPKHIKTKPVGYRFVKKTDDPSLSLRRIGGTAGTADMNWLNKNVQSHYFIKLEDASQDIEKLVAAINALPAAEERYWAVGPRTLSKSEAAELINPLVNARFH